MVDALAYALARAPLPMANDTSRDYAEALVPLMLESGFIEQEAAALLPEPTLDVDRAIDAMKVSAEEGHTPASDWISVGVVKAIIRGDHPILARLSEPKP